LVWTIEIARTAEKQIRKLDPPAQKSVIRFLRERPKSAENPRQWGKPLHGDKRGSGDIDADYRLICDIQDERITVLILEVAHR